MKISIKTLIIGGIATLFVGLLIGWFVFGQTEASEHAHAESDIEQQIWTCSMHPQIRKSEPGDCPICGMELIPLSDEQEEGVDPDAISMSATAMKLANVSTSVVNKGSVIKTIRLNGKVQEDERLIFSQSTHFPGRVEQLPVNFTGEYVYRGSVIAVLYSPALVTAQKELLEAYKFQNSQPQLYKAARGKLLNWKLTNAQIDEIIASGQIKEEFPVIAEQSGYVTRKMVNLGDYVKRGQALFEMANLSQVWVLFDVYENDLTWVNEGDTVQFTISSLSGKSFAGAIEYIDPVVQSDTRVSKARVVIKNTGNKIKPEMFASGEVHARLNNSDHSLTIPKSAIMWTGKRSVVYVKSQTSKATQFKMREVILGPALGDAYLIEDGLEEGEEIATHGTFSIDAAAQLAGKPSMMAQDLTSDLSMEPSLSVNQSRDTFDVVAEFKNQLRAVFKAYLPVKDALISSDAKLAGQKAAQLSEAIGQVDMELLEGKAHMEWMKDLKVLKTSVNGIENDLGEARMMLSPLSDQLFYTFRKFKVEVNGYRQYCPMAFDFTGAFWLSDSDEILNPYFGDAMLTCGNIEEEL